MIAALRIERLDDLLQPRPLGVVEPARDAEPLALRDEDEEAAGQRDLGRQPRALGLHRVLDRLHHDLLAAGDQVGDLLAVPLALELGHDDLVDVEEAVLLEADLDERGLHPGQDVVDRAEVDVAGDRAALRPLEVDLGDAVVLDDRDALLADVDGDQELALRLRQRRALLRHAAALLARRSCRWLLGRGARRPASASARAFDGRLGRPDAGRLLSAPPRPPPLPRCVASSSGRLSRRPPPSRSGSQRLRLLRSGLLRVIGRGASCSDFFFQRNQGDKCFS